MRKPIKDVEIGEILVIRCFCGMTSLDDLRMQVIRKQSHTNPNGNKTIELVAALSDHTVYLEAYDSVDVDVD